MNMAEHAIVTQINPPNTKPVDLELLECRTPADENRLMKKREAMYEDAREVVSRWRYIRSMLGESDTSLEGAELNNLSAILAAGK